MQGYHADAQGKAMCATDIFPRNEAIFMYLSINTINSEALCAACEDSSSLPFQVDR